MAQECDAVAARKLVIVVSQRGRLSRQAGMAYLQPRPSRGAGIFVRLVYWFAKRRLGRVPTPLGIMAYQRAILSAVAAFELALERATLVDVKIKELASLKAASLVGCRFCIDIGSSIARKHGIREAQLRALPFYETSAEFSPLERRVLDYTVSMTTTPSPTNHQLFLQLEAELGKAALVELTAAIAWENFRARFNHACGAVEEGFSENIVCMLAPATDLAPS